MDDSIDLKLAHKKSIRNRTFIENSIAVGCFYCEKTFRPRLITEWTDDGKTAICPFCSMDSILANSPETPIWESGFLKAMHAEFFTSAKQVCN